MFSFVTFEYILKNKDMLKFGFPKHFMLNTIKLNFFFFINKVLKWFGG
jgi:hypothetical protein